MVFSWDQHRISFTARIRRDLRLTVEMPISSLSHVKKIKRKVTAQQRKKIPAFVIGYTNAEPPPAGFLSAWFAQEFDEQLDVTFPSTHGTKIFDAFVHSRKAQVDTQCSSDVASSWHERLEWIHTNVAEIYPPVKPKLQDREQILHLARLARGLTELTEGTAYDLGTGTYANPSDWLTQTFDDFRIEDHVKIEHVERPDEGRVWFHTRGLGKFGFEEIEIYQGTGLSVTPVIEALAQIANSIILRGKPMRGGESIAIDSIGKHIEIVWHRTDLTYGVQLNLRGIQWA